MGDLPNDPPNDPPPRPATTLTPNCRTTRHRPDNHHHHHPFHRRPSHHSPRHRPANDPPNAPQPTCDYHPYFPYPDRINDRRSPLCFPTQCPRPLPPPPIFPIAAHATVHLHSMNSALSPITTRPAPTCDTPSWRTAPARPHQHILR